MRLARIAVALAVAGSVGVGIAGCGSNSTKASIPVPVPGSYVGVTSQGLPISFVVTAGDVVRNVEFGWRAKCEDGQTHSNTILLPGPRVHDGAFSLRGTLETGGIAHVHGTFDASGASGVLSRAKGSAFGTDCRATGIAWHAHVEPGSGSDQPPPAPLPAAPPGASAPSPS